MMKGRWKFTGEIVEENVTLRDIFKHPKWVNGDESGPLISVVTLNLLFHLELFAAWTAERKITRKDFVTICSESIQHRGKDGKNDTVEDFEVFLHCWTQMFNLPTQLLLHEMFCHPNEWKFANKRREVRSFSSFVLNILIESRKNPSTKKNQFWVFFQ